MAVKRYKNRKQLKQPDEFVTASSKLVKQVVEHKNKIISALTAIVVVVAIISTVNYFSNKAEDQSLSALSSVISQYETVQSKSGDVEAYKGTKDALTKVIETYGNKTGGKFANYFLAGCSFSAGEYKASETLYRKAVEDFKGVYPFEYLAKSSLAYALSQQGDHEGAAAIFNELASAANPLMGDESLFALARQYGAMGKTDLQKETSKKLIEKYPDSIFTNVVREQFPDVS